MSLARLLAVDSALRITSSACCLALRRLRPVYKPIAMPPQTSPRNNAAAISSISTNVRLIKSVCAVIAGTPFKGRNPKSTMTVGCRQEIRRSLNRSVSGILFERVQITNEESVENQRVRSIRTLASSSGKTPNFLPHRLLSGRAGEKVPTAECRSVNESIRQSGVASTAVIIKNQ